MNVDLSRLFLWRALNGGHIPAATRWRSRSETCAWTSVRSASGFPTVCGFCWLSCIPCFHLWSSDYILQWWVLSGQMKARHAQRPQDCVLNAAFTFIYKGACGLILIRLYFFNNNLAYVFLTEQNMLPPVITSYPNGTNPDVDVGKGR